MTRKINIYKEYLRLHCVKGLSSDRCQPSTPQLFLRRTPAPRKYRGEVVGDPRSECCVTTLSLQRPLREEKSPAAWWERRRSSYNDISCAVCTLPGQTVAVGVTSSSKSPGVTLGAQQLRLPVPKPQLHVLLAASPLDRGHVTVTGPPLSTEMWVSPARGGA